MVADRADAATAICELSKLIKDIRSAGLNIEARRGYEQSLLLLVEVPRERLDNAVYQSR
jgi:anoctamin-10